MTFYWTTICWVCLLPELIMLILYKPFGNDPRGICCNCEPDNVFINRVRPNASVINAMAPVVLLLLSMLI